MTTAADARRLVNRARRVSWQQQQAITTAVIPFPQETCNGKRYQALRIWRDWRKLHPRKRGRRRHA